eukprot:TRINITY_DN35593_c0_g1_i1.p1 TRINITY_DN35593_c0_g1~~TRINITY_DN35593_c0_g1_i1.p1  ORF type:complete len:231 (-),score=48.53 TRINITY_DN35593_c0_g1_i1:52-744(-)
MFLKDPEISVPRFSFDVQKPLRRTNSREEDFSSSIGENSNADGEEDRDDDDDCQDKEVQSSFKGPLESISALKDSLPVKGGLSRFFTGKSKSFTTISDAVSLKDLVKPENPYNKRRRILLSSSRSNKNWVKHRSFLSNGIDCARISKKIMHSNKSTLAVAIAMHMTENEKIEYKKGLQLRPFPAEPSSPPAILNTIDERSNCLSLRTFSLTDFQGAACYPLVENFLEMTE